jgi:uncharacterized OB-fold protein
VSSGAPQAELRARYERGELAFQSTADGKPVFPPRLRAPGDGGELRWETSAGWGEVFATTVVRRRGEDPRNLAIVELDEGFRMMSRVVGCPPDEVRIGMRVQVEFERDSVPVFRPA